VARLGALGRRGSRGPFNRRPGLLVTFAAAEDCQRADGRALWIVDVVEACGEGEHSPLAVLTGRLMAAPSRWRSPPSMTRWKPSQCFARRSSGTITSTGRPITSACE
jgi:hypothetical protein